MADSIKVAGIQMEPKILEKERNLERCLDFIQTAARQGAKLLVFPECALTGYCFSSLDEGLSVAEAIPGPSTEAIASVCKELEVYVVMGLLEKSGNKCYNALAFVGPEGLIGSYRKIHLPYLGIDRFATPGNQPFRVYDTPVGRVGLNICFDVRFPESARVMALQGAEIIALPTNWPKGAESAPRFIVHTRAYENRVNYIAVDRVGMERGFRFIGQSKIVDYNGRTLAEADVSREEIIYADLDLKATREKRVVIIPGEFELPLFEGRRPEFYGLICECREPVECQDV
ncbi:carbon-nitrogen hydrolase family protein [Candidatus Bathyarchaeota archaeon]|nr:carbon-nitrogen hydrolase family protein [Candidatus Bathyarchaeota archaeon]